MYGPDSYLYESNLSLLATLSDEELADPALIARLTAHVMPMADLLAVVVAAIGRAAETLGDWFAPTNATEVGPWFFPPLY